MLKSTRSYIQRSANRHENTLRRIQAEKAGFRSCRHIHTSYLEEFDHGSAALKYAGASGKIPLRPEDPALHLSISCLHLAIVDLLSVVYGRCCSRIQIMAVLEYIFCAPQSWTIGTLTSSIETP